MTQHVTGPESPWRLSVRERIALSRQRDARISAWTCIADADTADGKAAGPLAGVAFGVKDVIDVAGMPTRSGSPATSPVPCEIDAFCVAQLRAEGAIPIGKTVTAEFAYVSPGPTRNPHRLDHTPGGSSSGSAAAVAAGMVELALGTQTGGSIIRPAAFCGVVGFKPTFGRIHRQGMSVLCDSLDTIGWFTRTLEQAATIARVMLGPEQAPVARRAPRVALLAGRSLASLSAAAAAALNGCASRLRASGATITEPDCDEALLQLTQIHGEIMHAELARGLLALAQKRAEGLTPAVHAAIKRGLAISPSEYAALQQRRARLAWRWREQFGDVDYILAPSAPSEAPAGLASTGTSIFNRVWSLLGWPCLHIPIGVSEHSRLPVGVQCVGLPDHDLTLLEWASRLERLSADENVVGSADSRAK